MKNILEMQLSSEESIQILLAMLIGGIIGIEREISSKAAGFRTMILICMGSVIFTIISVKLGAHGSADRIAANILTGIGFIGAGVVFKDGFNVIGLTTAATIWVTAALGMAIGSHDYALACEGTVLTIIVLFLFEYIQDYIARNKHHRGYKITFQNEYKAEEILIKLNEFHLTYARKISSKSNTDFHVTLDTYGNKKNLEAFNTYLLNMPEVKSFDCWI